MSVGVLKKTYQAPQRTGVSSALKVDDVVSRLRASCPILASGLAYLDNASTTQKPAPVVDRITRFYSTENANVHRGVYRLSETATVEYEKARQKVANYLGGVATNEVVFTSGTTESINLVASSWCQTYLREGDEILVTVAEHHSNIVPWQLAAERAKAKVLFAPLDEFFRIDLQAMERLITPRTKVIAVAHVSNVLGVIHPLEAIVALAKKVGAITVIDGAQAVPHMQVDVKALDCDFYAFSGHKTMGPTGIGVLYGKSRWLEAMPPYQSGGGMICMVTTSGSTFVPAPEKFEAGTPHVAGAIGLGAALDVLSELPLRALSAHQYSLGEAVFEGLKANSKVRLFAAPGPDWTGIVSFYHESVHPHDMAAVADSMDVAVRAGHHCAQPLMRVFGVGSTTRVSPYFYNTLEDIERFFAAVEKAEGLFS